MVVAERDFVAGLDRFFGAACADLEVGIGDDAAVVRTRRGDRVVLCCDPVIERVHFDPETPLSLVGRKAVNRNLADLAAMGAVPDWLLVSVVASPTHTEAQLRTLLGGVRAAARRAGARVVGGDLAASRGPLVVTVSAYGHLTRPALRRDGGQIGDSLHVSGPLGGSRHGHHLRFAPPLAEGRWLCREAAVHAALDVSDGLLLDLATLVEASSRRSGKPLGAELDAAALPIRAAALRAAGGDRQRALAAALTDGEDHVLLWTQATGRTLPRGGPLTARARRPIGRLIAAPGLWLRHGGQLEPLAVDGYQHRFR